MSTEIIKETSKEINNETSQIYQLKFNNDEDGNSVGFKKSKYRESNITDTQIVKKTTITDNKINKKFFWCAGKLNKQTYLMLWKNYLVFSRNIKPTVFQLLCPILICIVLVFLQKICDNFTTSFINKNPTINNLGNLEKCIYPDDCTTVGYGVIVSKLKS